MSVFSQEKTKHMRVQRCIMMQVSYCHIVLSEGKSLFDVPSTIWFSTMHSNLLLRMHSFSTEGILGQQALRHVGLTIYDILLHVLHIPCTHLS